MQPKEDWSGATGAQGRSLSAVADPYIQQKLFLMARAPGFKATDADTFAMPAAIAQRDAQLAQTTDARQKRIFRWRLPKLGSGK